MTKPEFPASELCAPALPVFRGTDQIHPRIKVHNSVPGHQQQVRERQHIAPLYHHKRPGSAASIDDPPAELAGHVQREHARILLCGLHVFVPHQRHLVLH